MNKATTTNVTTPLYWPEDDALEQLSKRLGVPKAGALRIGLFELLKVHFPEKAKELTRARIDAHARQKLATWTCLLLSVHVWIQTILHDDNQDMRQAKKAVGVRQGGRGGRRSDDFDSDFLTLDWRERV